jgi:hypothetical protein
MPTSDELLTQMIRATIHANEKLKRIGIIDLDPRAVLDRFRRCLPQEHAIEISLYPVIRGEDPGWLHSSSHKTPAGPFRLGRRLAGA